MEQNPDGGGRGREGFASVSPFRTDESSRNSMYARPIPRWKTL